jgi:flagellar hook-associated protein 3 FlgL
MAININGYGTSSVLNQSVLNLKNQLTVLQSQLTTGEKSTTYAGMGVNEGFAIAARSQLANISAFTDTMTNINTNIGIANGALQSLADIGNTVLSSANGSSPTLNSSGQSVAQQTAGSQLSSMLGILNTQAGNNYLFSGSAINTPPVASYNTIINGTTTQAGLQQVIAQRQQADLGISSLSGAVVTSPTATSVQVAGASAPYGFTLTAISATGAAVAVTSPTGSPAAGSVALTAQPAVNDKINFSFKLPDGTTQQIQLTAGTSFAIGATTANTATNLNAALTTAVGAITIGLGRVAITTPTTTSVQVAQDSSPFGLKLNSISVTPAAGTAGTAESVTPPTGSPPAMSVTLNSQPSNGDQFNFSFKLPDGTTQQIQLTATTTNPPPTGSFLIDPPPSSLTTNTTSNLQTALTGAVWTLANTSLVAASAVQAGNDFFSAGTATGGVADNQLATPAPITGATLLSGTAPSDSLTSSFAAGNTITVNGTPITFVASGATGNELNVTDSVQTLLSKIDSITGTSTPSTISGGAITLHTDDAPDLTITSSNTAAFAALGFGATVTGTLAPLRVSGSPLGSATSLVSGTPANTVSWYTGNQGPTASARASATARIDSSVTVQYGMQADESAIRSQLQTLAVFAAFTTSPTGTNSAAQITALSQEVTQNLSAQPGQQTIQDIQSDLATAQATMSDAAARQTQAQSMLQNLVDQTENVSPDQVASEILSLQTSLQASYQTTSMLSQLTLTKYLPVG